MTIVLTPPDLADRAQRLAPGPGQPLESAAATVRRIDSRRLLGAADEIEITHRSQIYRLRRTSLGKLILTK
jgi:hemin uptake protein HemP